MARRARVYWSASHASGGSGCGAGCGPSCPGSSGAAGRGVGVSAGDQGDHLPDDRPVGAGGHDGGDEGVAGDGLGVLAAQVAVLAGAGAEPGVFDDGGAVEVEEVADADAGVDAGVGACPVGDHLRALGLKE